MDTFEPERSERPVDAPARSERHVDAPGHQTSIQETALWKKVVKTNDSITLQELDDWFDSGNPSKFVDDLNNVVTWCRVRRNLYYNQKKALEKLEQETVPSLKSSLETANASADYFMEDSERQKKTIQRLLKDAREAQYAQPEPQRSERHETPASTHVQASGSRVIKLPDPPLFSGADPSLFDDWAIQVKNKLRGNAESYPDELLKILYVSSRLTGDALKLTNPRLDEENPMVYRTVTEFLFHLKELYSDPNKIHNARRAFQSLMMKAGQSFQEFYATFLRLVAESRTSQDQLKYELNEKLALKLQESVAIYYNDPSIDVTQFAQRCTTIDQQNRVRQGKQDRMAKRFSKNTAASSTTGYVPPQQQAIKPFVPSSIPSRTSSTDKLPLTTPAGNGKATDMSAIQCYNCGEYGHYQSDCTQPKSTRKHPGLASIEEEAIVTDMVLEYDSDSEN